MYGLLLKMGARGFWLGSWYLRYLRPGGRVGCEGSLASGSDFDCTLSH